MDPGKHVRVVLAFLEIQTQGLQIGRVVVTVDLFGFEQPMVIGLRPMLEPVVGRGGIVRTAGFPGDFAALMAIVQEVAQPVSTATPFAVGFHVSYSSSSPPWVAVSSVLSPSHPYIVSANEGVLNKIRVT